MYFTWYSLSAALICIGHEAKSQDVPLGSIPIIREIERLALQQGVPIRTDVFREDPPLQNEYDFVIVGSGPGGSVLANRLTEREDWSVLLIEKGQEGDLFNEIPSVAVYTVFGEAGATYEVAEDGRVCTGKDKGICHFAAGKGLGGGTLVNAMVMTRGSPSDYDEWAEAGNPGWSYDDILKYFLKVENMTIPELAGSRYHSVSGPVSVEYPYRTTLGDRFVNAGREFGYNVVDYNDPGADTAFSPTQTSIKNGQRMSAATAYLHPIRNRPNLTVLKGATATKILIDINKSEACGVKYKRGDKESIVFSRKEVILSAGSFGSPQLLMLSGIGRREHLESLNIGVVQDLPVGDNLQEHLTTPALIYLIDTDESFPMPKVVSGAQDGFQQWIQGRGGPFASNGPEALGFIKTQYATDKADVELALFPMNLASDGGIFAKTMKISDNVYDRTWRKIDYREGFMIAPINLYPRSRGTVRLKSADPDEPPEINANFLKDPQDVTVIIAGIRAAMRLSQAGAFSDSGARLYTEPVAGCEGYPFDSDQYWGCVIASVPQQLHHQSGSCRMGPDPSVAVVNSKLCVHGIRGLRVVDASVMPTLPGAHTMLPTYMVAENAADIIKSDWDIDTVREYTGSPDAISHPDF